MLSKLTLLLVALYCTDIEGGSGIKHLGPPVDAETYYTYYPNLHGWLNLHQEPADWKSAQETCHNEGALFASSWTYEFDTTLLNVMRGAKNPSIAALYSGAQIVFPEGVYSEVQGGSADSKELNGTYCMVLYSNSTVGKVDCKHQYPFVCFVPTKDEPEESTDIWSDYEYYPKVQGWLKWHESANWETARVTCQNEGAVLASLWTQKFESALNDIMSENELLAPDVAVRTLYTGAQLTYPEGVYYDNRGELQYSNVSNTYCVVLHANDSIPRNVDCSYEFPYVCYSPGSDHDCGDGYKLNNRTGQCYSFRDVGRNWTDSRKMCQENEADLAIINSDEEANYLKELYSNYDTLYYTYHGSHVFVGIQETDVGVWKTIEGDTLEGAGFSRWSEGEPDNKQSNWPDYVQGVRQACGTFTRDGLFSDCWCEMYHAYICEKKAVRKAINQ